MIGKHSSGRLNTDLKSQLHMEEGENLVDAIGRNYHFIREGDRKIERESKIRREASRREISPSQQAIATELSKQYNIRMDNARLEGDISEMIQREAR